MLKQKFILATTMIHPLLSLLEIKNDAKTSSVLDQHPLSYCGQHTIAFYVKRVVALGGFVSKFLLTTLEI